MKRDPVVLDWEQRRRALEELIASLERHAVEKEIFSVDGIHLHGMIRCTDHNPKHWLGIAKKESSHFCKQSRHAPVGGIWAHGCKCLPIRDHAHYGNTRGYIRDHRLKGAVIWERAKPPDMESFDPDSLLIR